MRRRPWLTLALCAGVAGGARAQDSGAVRVAPGSHYAAGWLHRWLFGTDYRSLWTLELSVHTLDMGTFAGGLTPTTAGGGNQTKSLRFRGADGYQYGFRSIDKDPGGAIPPEFAGTFIDDLVSDQTSAQHPYAPAVAAPLQEALGILHTSPELVVLPDDARLGRFRERFAGTVGFIERRATIEPDRPGFADALEIIGSADLFTRTQHGPADRLDIPAFLTARLFDMWVSDWDRHRGQWTWARMSDGPVRRWVVIPEDRDQAFARYDGLLLGPARWNAPFLLNFGPSYGDVFGATWNGRDLDRRFLTVVPAAMWDSVARSMVARLPDQVIDDAVSHLPPEVYQRDGARLARQLKTRRDGLVAYAERFRRLLVNQADVHATDASEVVTVERSPDELRITIAEPGAPPHVVAAFRPGETHGIRLYLHGGRDRVTVRGPRDGISLRIVGEGGDLVADSSGDGGVRLYATDADSATGRVAVDRRATVAPPPRRPYEFRRDFGNRVLSNVVAGVAPDLGLTLGVGATHTSYAFRKYPFASAVEWSAAMALGPMRPIVGVDWTRHHENTRRVTRVSAGYTGVEILRFHGLGNNTTITQPDVYYRVRQEQIRLAPSITFAAGPQVALSLGAVAERLRTRADSGRIIAATTPYGTGTFVQAGVEGGVTVDTRDRAAYPTRGVVVRLGGRLFPPIGDIDTAYGSVEGEASTYWSPAGTGAFAPTLALRAGAKGVWGGYPFYAAAFLGDAATARLGRPQRYAGDAALWGNAELRFRLTHFFFILPGEFGVFGLADGGRVFLSGESSSTWHTAVGGGIWLSVLEPGAVVHAAIAHSAERNGFYFGLGMAY